ncbi:BTB/POZ domain-containing protein At1g63850-like [Abrus precatorius]|uniref:BTB/POZ domain-containing protein At1g63850-like n=1 Tax=Abrus precatorius TaxID=3816 RepID=A0A8B8KD36_ABRPR|nr:BTB/POZ domain-containing protein At1g63850-like [Abrus precatorius]XP_027341651.1 BTB/POZ domain-containing protein At1g63850-like [Abrus precatorius]
MAATTTTTFLKVQNQPTKPKRRKYRETTISASASPNDTHTTPRRTHDFPLCATRNPEPEPDTALPDSPSTYKIRFSPGGFSPIMDFTHGSPIATVNGHSGHDPFPSSFSKFNSALTAGLLNPMSPPPDKARSSPTLFEMMASEPDIQQRPTQMVPNNVAASSVQKPQIQVLDRQTLMMQRISELLGSRSPGNQFNDAVSSDIKLTLSSKDGISVSMNVHRQILVAHSRFFAVKLSDRWTKQQQQRSPLPYEVEIADCDDVEVYIETLRLMYCKDLRKRLMKEDVSRVLGILKVSAAIGFDAGVLSCLEYLEAAPWAEDEEEKVASLLSELHLEAVGAGEVLKRVSTDVANGNGNEEGNDNEEVLLKLIRVVLEGKDEKARREMKGLVSKMLRENSSQNDLRKESLYLACDDCLQLLRRHFLQAAASELQDVSQIARQADNLHWILDILIDRQIAEDFLKTWASQSDLAEAHPKVPAVHRFEVSRVTARLFVGIGKGQLLASKDVRCLLLKTWLVPFYDDFGWMRRATKGLDRHLIEDGLSNTILTLPLSWQQEILLAWFNRFLNSGEDCPNIQRGFEVWWRRAFWKRNGEQERTRPLRITTTSVENP